MAGDSRYLRWAEEYRRVNHRPVNRFPLLQGQEAWAHAGALREAAQRFAQAVEGRDIMAMADAVVDTVLVAFDAAAAHGIDIDHAAAMVHDARMRGPLAERPSIRDLLYGLRSRVGERA